MIKGNDKGLLCLFALAAMISTASCGNKDAAKPQAPAAVPVTLQKVEKTPAVYHEEFPGTVTAMQQTEIRAQVTGYITGIYFKDGARVAKGQRLYTIDQQTYAANFDQAVANLELQKTNLDKAQKDADRYHDLDRQDAIAKQQVDYADAALEAAKKQVDAAKANVAAVRANVRFANITAPFTGTVGISQVRNGTSVVAGQTILNTISSDDPIAVDFPVDQSEIYEFSSLEQGKKSDSTFTLAFGDQIYPATGSIDLIDRAVDPQTGTIRVRLRFPNTKRTLKPGMSTTVRVLHNGDDQAITIPYKAVTEQLGEYLVYVASDSNTVTQRRIKLGRQIGANVIVTEGLTPGEMIAVEGVQNLREGAAITTGAPAAKKP